MNGYYEAPHGTKGFRMQFFAERLYPSPCHYCDEYELLYLADGKMRLGIDDEEYIIKKGDIIFIDKNELHYLLPTEDNSPFCYCPVLFGDSIFGGENDPCRRFLRDNAVNRFLEMDSELMEMMPELFLIDREKKNGYEFILKSWIFKVIGNIIASGQYSERATRKKESISSEEVKIIIDYIEEHFREKITLPTLVSKTMYSENHIIRLFKRYTGMTVIEYLNKFRVANAANDLVRTNKTVTEVANDNGFEHSHYFTRLFVRYRGLTPLEYRKRYSVHNR